MAEMTEEEANELDERLTKMPPTVDFGKPGVFARQRELLNVLNPVVADYILTCAMASHKMPSQIIGEMVNKEIAARV
jgi:hypothetical protein